MFAFRHFIYFFSFPFSSIISWSPKSLPAKVEVTALGSGDSFKKSAASSANSAALFLGFPFHGFDYKWCQVCSFLALWVPKNWELLNIFDWKPSSVPTSGVEERPHRHFRTLDKILETVWNDQAENSQKNCSKIHYALWILLSHPSQMLNSYLSSPVSSFSSSSNTFLLVPITFFSSSSTTS